MSGPLTCSKVIQGRYPPFDPTLSGVAEQHFPCYLLEEEEDCLVPDEEDYDKRVGSLFGPG